MAVCRSRLGEYDAALAVFDELLAVTAATDDLFALSALGKGRVFYEQEDYASALDAYALVPRDSARIGDALYEISWSFIQLERLPQAVHQLRVMQLVDDPNGRSFPESQLLLGDVRLRMEDYDAAVSEFEAVSNRYLPVEQELDAVLADVQRETDLLARLIDAEQGTLPLPPLAEAWFESNDELDRAIGARQDVARMRDDIEFSRNEIVRLDAALSEGSSVNILPGLRDGWRQGLALENVSIAAWVTLVERERSLVESSLSGTTRSEADRRREQRILLQQRFEAMPRDFAAIDAREAGVISELSQISEATFRAQLELEDGLREVESLRRVLRQQVRTGERPTSSLAAEDGRLDAIESNLTREQTRLQALQQQINVRQIEVSVGDDVARSERQIKRDLISALQAEAGALRGAREGSAQWSRFDGLYNGLAELNSTLESFFGDMDVAAAEETAEFRSALDAERARIDHLEEEVDLRDSVSAAMVDDVAQAALIDVRDRFGDISLRANLGIIDVAWRQKEDLTDSIEALFDERRQRLEVLEADFAEILAE
ncbi:MAG: tetratricopeptide (TPR) repeat protein [Bradymonadia bacterium]